MQQNYGVRTKQPEKQANRAIKKSRNMWHPIMEYYKTPFKIMDFPLSIHGYITYMVVKY